MSRRARACGLVVALALACLAPARAQHGEPATPAARYFQGLALTDQDGRRVDLYRDLMAGRVVVVQTFFTACPGICPLTTKSFLALQARFADRLGQELLLISITADPRNDTPEKLRAYAMKVGAHSGWRFLTGSVAEVDAALKRFGQATQAPEGHSNLFLAGNDRTGLWKKLLGLAPAGEIGDAVASVLEDPAHADALSPGERRGRELFLRGTTAGRAVPVTLNGEPSPVAAACASCHGRDGRGRPEGGLEPADVRWQTLSHPLAATGRRAARPAYDPARVMRAVTMGIDAAGRSLDPLMPRYRLQREDADDLLAFLTRLGTLADPGLAPDAVRVGLLVASGPDGDAARAHALAWAAGLAERGGLYARRPEVVFLQGADALDRLAERDEPFVLVGVPDAASFEAVAAWAARREVPWVLSRPSDALPAFDTRIVVLAPAPRGVPPAVAALEALERALERIGRDVTRENLVEALEAVRESRR